MRNDLKCFCGYVLRKSTLATWLKGAIFATHSKQFSRKYAMQVTANWLRTSGVTSSLSRLIGGTADLKHYTPAFAEWGSGSPVVLATGLAGGIELVAPLARRLALRHHVIAVESRGERDSFALRQRFSINDLAGDLAEFVDWRGLECPALMGVSFGGVVGLAAVARNPGRFSSLSLQGVGGRYEFGLIQRIASLVLSSYPLPEDCPFLNQFFSVLFGGRPTQEQLRHAVSCCWQTDQCVIMHRMRLLKRLDIGRLLPDVTVPTLVVSGGRDAVVSAANAKLLQDRLIDCHQTVIPRAGHLAPLSHTAATADAVAGFLAAITD
ncbi:MAG: alpha/beta hydrolase [Gemmataceae bacterium]|nr:alpha/beta hydrolase [Gemmataceae bacterium]